MSTSVTSVTNHFPSAENGFSTTTSASVSSGATTVQLNSVAGYDNGEVVVFVIDPTIPTKKQTFTGVVDTAGTQITSVVWTAGTNTSHDLGATVVDYAAATHISMISKGLSVEHNQDGTHKNVTADSLTVDGTTTLTGALTVKSYDGYIYPTYTPVYVSATSIKVTGVDVTAQFPSGTKIKLTQTTAKYFYVTSSTFSTDTTINITGGSDYTVANAAITDFAYSYDSSPQAFPDWFNWSPTFTGFSANPTNTVHRFKLNGKLCTMIIRHGTQGTSNTNAFTLTLPITAKTLTNHLVAVSCAVTDNGATPTTPGMITIGSAGTSLAVFKDHASGVWTTSGGKRINSAIVGYEVE